MNTSLELPTLTKLTFLVVDAFLFKKGDHQGVQQRSRRTDTNGLLPTRSFASLMSSRFAKMAFTGLIDAPAIIFSLAPFADRGEKRGNTCARTKDRRCR